MLHAQRAAVHETKPSVDPVLARPCIVARRWNYLIQRRPVANHRDLRLRHAPPADEIRKSRSNADDGIRLSQQLLLQPLEIPSTRRGQRPGLPAQHESDRNRIDILQPEDESRALIARRLLQKVLRIQRHVGRDHDVRRELQHPLCRLTSILMIRPTARPQGVLGELALDMQTFDRQIRRIIRPDLSFTLRGRLVVGEIDVADLMAHLRELPAELHLKRVPAEFIDKDAHRSRLIHPLSCHPASRRLQPGRDQRLASTNIWLSIHS